MKILKIPIPKLLLGLFFCLATLIYLEIGIRYLANSYLTILRTDQDVGTTHIPNYTGWLWDAESKHKNYIITNKLGYIGENYNIKKNYNNYRIAVIGDSIVEGLQVNYYQNFTKLLQNTLNTAKGDKKYEVMNYGVGGVGNFLEYQTYKKNIIPYKPDLILLFFHDDYQDNLNKSNFNLEMYAEQRKSLGLKKFLLNFELPKVIFSKLQNSVTFINFLRTINLYESANSPSIKSDANQGITSQYYTYTFEIIKKFNQLVEQNGSKLIIVIYPSEEDYIALEKWKNNPNIVKLINFLKQENISYYNPAPELAKIKISEKLCLTYNCGGHLNEYGHQIMAKILYQYLLNTILTNK